MKIFVIMISVLFVAIHNVRRHFMAKELTCPMCEAEIPLNGDETSGDLVLCSYCNMTFKMIKKMDDWTLEEDFEE